MSLILRSGTYNLVRRVPKRFHSVEERRQIWISLNTDSPVEAAKKKDAAWAEMVAAWEARLAGESDEAEKRYAAAREIAQRHGFRYLPIREVAELPLDQIISRIDAARDRKGRVITAEARGTLGAVDKPELTVSQSLDAYWRIADDRTLGKSADQVRRWRNPRIKAINNFVAVVGDRPLAEISADDMQDFRDWWMGRIRAGEVLPASANKDLTHLGDVLKTVNKAKRLGLDLPLGGWAIKQGEKRIRPAFSPDWITDKIIPGLGGLNTEARCLVLGMVNTGFRPSEGACLGRDQIRLDAAVPHLSIEPVGRTLKTQYARRVIPLLGVSLEAFRQCPDGFPRYAETSASLSALVNKYLGNNGLKETEEHTLYSLRHSFQDRMLAAGIDDRIRRDLFGHSLTEERYGEGASLEHKARLLAPMSF